LVPVVGVARLVSDVPANIPAGDVVVVLDRVQDQGNVGTIVRTARAFGVRDLVSTCPDLDLFYKKTIDASRGTVFDARLRRYASGVAAIGALKAQGYQVVATSSYGRSVQALALLQEKPVALVVGNETTGVADDILAAADAVVQIPLSGPVESLNVGVAAGISVYELKMKVVLAMLVRHIRATLGREVSVAGTLIRQAFDAALRAVSDLTSAQVILLMQLACDEAMTPEQISRDTATSGVELEDLLRPLHVRGYIAVSSLADGSIRVTGEGERALAALWPVVERSEERILAGFADDERAQLRAYLGRLQANCALVTAPKGEEVTS
jgi:TrmH family RNA methyltransferase